MACRCVRCVLPCCLYNSVRSATSGTVSFKPSMKAAALSTSVGTVVSLCAQSLSCELRSRRAQFLELVLLRELPTSGYSPWPAL